jgi:uncharacterized phage protein (TIGR02220 family)
MAGDWIKMRCNLWDDPRVSNLCDLSGSTEAAVIGGLYRLWVIADQHSEHGDLPGMTVKAIDRKTGVKGLGEALVSIGWIDDTPEGVKIAKFDEHNGESAKVRAQTARRVARHKGNAQVTQEVTLGSLPTDDSGNADSVTSALPREEKIREEEKHMSTVTEVLAYLNSKANRNFQAVPANTKLIAARLREGATVEQLKAVVDAKVRDWAHDPKMCEYLRPATLFNAEKFGQYVGALGAAPARAGSPSSGVLAEYDDMMRGTL